jgi:hypothetical protein
MVAGAIPGVVSFRPDISPGGFPRCRGSRFASPSRVRA